MKAEEIRIGNWVKYYETIGRVVEISNRGGQFITMDKHPIEGYSHGQYAIEKINPIEISPEILEKAATYAKNYSYYFDVPELKRTVVITWYDNEQKRVFLNDNYIGVLHLQYVHELQNLIHALTGSELPLNL